MKTPKFFWRKLSKLHKKKHNFASDRYIFPKTRANQNKQWTHFSALKTPIFSTVTQWPHIFFFFFKSMALTQWPPIFLSISVTQSQWLVLLDPTPAFWGHIVLIGPQVCKWVKFYIFRLSYKLTSHDLWPSFVTFDVMNTWRFLFYIISINRVGSQPEFNFSNEVNFTFWAHLSLQQQQR